MVEFDLFNGDVNTKSGNILEIEQYEVLHALEDRETLFCYDRFAVQSGIVLLETLLNHYKKEMSHIYIDTLIYVVLIRKENYG